ncbi:MAG TPA: hypothetical protein VFO84_06715 [Dehalococcoidia bacterium]|nr:hypothetical protein [Dehalococcoidia bacterium]
MARRKGLRVTCAVCNRVFYLDKWGEPLEEHTIGRGESPLCSGSLRAEYLPTSNEAMAAQLEWASGRVPEAKRPTRSKGDGQCKVVAARRADQKRLQTQIARAGADLNDLLQKGLDLQRQRADGEASEALELLAEHEEVLRSERQLRSDIARAEKKLEKLEGD